MKKIQWINQLMRIIVLAVKNQLKIFYFNKFEPKKNSTEMEIN